MSFVPRWVLLWFVLAMVAVLNGLLRETVLAPVLGERLALPVSGILLSTLLILVVYLAQPRLGVTDTRSCFLLGLLWLAMTLCFEYLFGHYIAGKAWSEIHQVFNPAGGNLFLLVMLATLTAPWLAAKLRGVL